MSIAPNTELGLVRLTVRDLTRARAFYEGGLGLQVLHASGGRLVLGAAENHPLLELRPSRIAAPIDPELPGLGHVGLVVPSRRDLAVTLFRLAQQGIGLTGASDHMVSEAVYLEDPDGNGISVSRDRARSAWPRGASGRPNMPTLALDLKDLANEIASEVPLPERVTRMREGTRIGHLHLRVGNLRRSEAFYAGVLGFEVTAREDTGRLFMATGGYHHHLGLEALDSRRETRAPSDAIGLRSFELRLPTSAALADVIDRIVAEELPLEEVADGTVVHDPSGIPIILTA